MVVVRRLFSKIDINDADRVQNEKERSVPFSASPFGGGGHAHLPSNDDERPQPERSGQPPTEGSGEKEGPSRHPEWLELSGDLAWTATFSSLTSSVQVTQSDGLYNYTVYFLLVWHLWGTQTIYDLNYYSNDWFHRIAFALQLLGYATLSAFSADFKVMWGFDDGPQDTVDQNNSTAVLIAKATEAHDLQDMKVSFQGLNYMLFISRVILFVQYARILYYKRKHRFFSWRSILTPLSIIVAGFIFLSCGLLVTFGERSRNNAIRQIVLWGVAMVLQVAAQLGTPQEQYNAGSEDADLVPRMSTLTVIIFGEGLNGICQTLQHSINSLGLTRQVIGIGVAVAVVLYFIWILYFDGWRSTRKPRKITQDIWMWFHAPFHLCMILFLQGLKNVFLSDSVIQGVNKFSSKLDGVSAIFNQTGQFQPSDEMTRTLAKVDMSWDLEVQRLNTALQANATYGLAELWRWSAQVVHSVILAYIDNPDQDAEKAYQAFLASDDATLEADLLDPEQPLFSNWDNMFINGLIFSATNVLAFAGAVMLCLGFLNILQRRHRDRFMTASTTIRLASGAFLIFWCIYSLQHTGQTNPSAYVEWLIPTIAFVTMGAGLSDILILYLSNRSIKKQEAGRRWSLRDQRQDSREEKRHLTNPSVTSDWDIPMIPRHSRNSSGEASRVDLTEKRFSSSQLYDPVR